MSTSQATLPKAGVPSEPADLENALAQLGRPLRVLLAEDSGTNQLVFSKLVQGFAIELSIAANGVEALERARAESFDVVFMDMRMPEMDGLEASRALRALGGPWSGITIIALTANAFPEDITACHEAGMNDFISKPIRKKVLFERLIAAASDESVLHPAPSLDAVVPTNAIGDLLMSSVAHVALADLAPILDRHIFVELIESMSTEDVRSMFGLFVAETVTRINLLRHLDCANDRVRIEEEALTLRGAAGAAGLGQLFELAKTLEQSAATMTATDYTEILARLDAALVDARAEIDRQLASVAAA